MTAINIIEIESDDDLVILDEIEDIASNFSVGIDWDSVWDKPAPNEGNTSTSTSFSNKINLSSICC